MIQNQPDTNSNSQTSRKGSNQDALNVNTLIDLYTQLLQERLAMTHEAMSNYEDEASSHSHHHESNSYSSSFV